MGARQFTSPRKNLFFAFISIILLGFSLYQYHHFGNYIIIDEEQKVGDTITVKKIKLSRGAYVSIRGADEYGRPGAYFLSTFYLSPGTYTNLLVKLQLFIPIKTDSKSLYYQPLEFIEVKENIFKYIPNSGDEFYVLLLEKSSGHPVKNFLGKPVQKRFFLK